MSPEGLNAEVAKSNVALFCHGDDGVLRGRGNGRLEECPMFRVAVQLEDWLVF